MPAAARPSRRWRRSRRGTGWPASRRAAMTPEPAGRARRHLRVQFPAGRADVLRAVEDVSLHDRRGRDARAGRRERQRQEHARQRRRGLAAPDRRHDAVSRAGDWTRPRARSAQQAIQIVFQDPFGALDPRMPVSAHHRRAVAHPAHRQSAPNARARAADAGRTGGPAARRAEPLSARILRRPAPAHRHRPRARAGAGADRRRRAAVGARRLDPEPDSQSAADAAAGARGWLICSSATIWRW